jgi:undecaprenyl-diphosphatase
MTILQSIFLGIIQGITEFFPISSSGHLILLEHFMKLPVHALRSFDIAVHFGSLLAIFIYFRKDFVALIKSTINIVSGKIKKTELIKNEVIWLIIASVPAVIVGVLLNPIFDEYFRSDYLVSIFMIITGIYFLISEKFKTTEKKLTWKNTLLIGISQAFAILPGVSRSGSTIATGIFCGIKREDAARFSFILGSIAVTGATLLTTKDILETGLTIDLLTLMIGILSSGIASLLSIHYLMKLLKTKTLFWFAIYLFAVGGLMLLI